MRMNKLGNKLMALVWRIIFTYLQHKRK